MATKKELLANLRNYTPEEIADAIRVGEVTMYELGKYAGGQFTPLLKRKVKTLLAQPEVQPQPESPQTSAPKQVMPQPEMNMQHQASAPQYHTPVQDYGTPYSNNTLRQDTQPLSFEPNKPSEHPAYPSATPFSTPHGGPISSPYSPAPSVAPGPPYPERPLPEYEPEPQESYYCDEETQGTLSRVFSFKGRIHRTEYFVSFLIYEMVYGINVGLHFIHGIAIEIPIIINIVSFIFMMWFVSAQTCKRCHDFGYSGWWQLVPGINIAALFIPRNEFTNKYGKNLN
jgi:uncharacterized membrane protein YhaH (DUF805 family)